MSLEIIERIQPDLFAKIASESFFAPICLFAIREHRFISEINEALSSATFDPSQGDGKLPGNTIEILMPMLVDASENAPGPEVTVEERLIVKDNPTISLGAGGTGLTAEYIATRLLRTLHKFAIAYDKTSGLTFFPAPNCMAPNRDFVDQGIVAYDVVLHARFNFGEMPNTPNPIMAENDLTVTLSLPVGAPASDIYYTTDGSFPGPGATAAASLTGTAAASTAILYTEPFTVLSGTVVRAAAYATSGAFAGSNVTWLYVY